LLLEYGAAGQNTYGSTSRLREQLRPKASAQRPAVAVKGMMWTDADHCKPYRIIFRSSVQRPRDYGSGYADIPAAPGSAAAQRPHRSRAGNACADVHILTHLSVT
jgi:hypothetical protein